MKALSVKGTFTADAQEKQGQNYNEEKLERSSGGTSDRFQKNDTVEIV